MSTQLLLLSGWPDPQMTALRQALVQPGVRWRLLDLAGLAPAECLRRLPMEIAESVGEECLVMVDDLPRWPAESLLALRAQCLRLELDWRVACCVRTPRWAMEVALETALQGELPGNLDGLYPRYRDSFARLDRLFGEARVEAVRLLPGDPLQEINRQLDLGLPPRLRMPAQARYLPAFLLRACWAHRRRHGPGLDPATLPPAKGPRQRIAADALRPVFIAAQDDISWMELRLDMVLAEDMSTDATCINGLADLDRFDAKELAQLRTLFAPAAALPAPDDDPAAVVAGWLESWRQGVAARR